VNLPEMPIAGSRVANELDAVCNITKCKKLQCEKPENLHSKECKKLQCGKCKNLNDWFNGLYLFKVKYSIYKEELKK